MRCSRGGPAAGFPQRSRGSPRSGKAVLPSGVACARVPIGPEPVQELLSFHIAAAGGALLEFTLGLQVDPDLASAVASAGSRRPVEQLTDRRGLLGIASLTDVETDSFASAGNVAATLSKKERPQIIPTA